MQVFMGEAGYGRVQYSFLLFKQPRHLRADLGYPMVVRWRWSCPQETTFAWPSKERDFPEYGDSALLGDTPLSG
jgi:hypothetical protein